MLSSRGSHLEGRTISGSSCHLCSSVILHRKYLRPTYYKKVSIHLAKSHHKIFTSQLSENAAPAEFKAPYGVWMVTSWLIWVPPIRGNRRTNSTAIHLSCIEVLGESIDCTYSWNLPQVGIPVVGHSLMVYS